MTRRRLVAGVVAALSVGCVTMRVYELPLSPAEGQAMVPALISAARQQGLEAWQGPSGALATLEDGVQLSWQSSADERQFILVMSLPNKIPDAEAQARFEVAKARADALWQAAASSRAAFLPPPQVLVAPAPVVAQPAPAVVEPVPAGIAATVSVPGVSISVGTSAGSAMGVAAHTLSQSASSSASCCLNGEGFSCPSSAALDRCSGAFMRCLAACNFTCEARCAREAPPDPSDCRRDVMLDASCRQR